MLLAAGPIEAREPRSFLAWLFPASIAIHVLAVVLLPGRAPHRAAAPPLALLVLSEPPPPPPPTPPTPPEPSAPAARAAPARAPARAARPDDVARAPAPEAPVDFTGTVFSNDGPGVAVAVAPEPERAAPAAPPAPAPARRIEPARPVFVPAASLGRRPQAPGLDAELERQYPADARRSGISGIAVLKVELLPDGRVGHVVQVSESWSGFGVACERTVRGGRWEPPMDKEGRPVATEIKYVCRFEVRS